MLNLMIIYSFRRLLGLNTRQHQMSSLLPFPYLQLQEYQRIEILQVVLSFAACFVLEVTAHRIGENFFELGSYLLTLSIDKSQKLNFLLISNQSQEPQGSSPCLPCLPCSCFWYLHHWTVVFFFFFCSLIHYYINRFKDFNGFLNF